MLKAGPGKRNLKVLAALVLLPLVWGQAGLSSAATTTTERGREEAGSLPLDARPPAAVAPAPLLDTFAPDEVLLKLDPSILTPDLLQSYLPPGMAIVSDIGALDVLLVKVPSGEVLSSIATLSAIAGVLYAEPNYIAAVADTIPNDPGWADQYGLTAIRAPQGWDLATGAESVTIAVVDTGVDTGHPDLAAKIVAGYDFVNGDADPQDDNGHGTHVAGIAAASSNNGLGVAGLSWGARVMPVKVLNAAGNGTFADVAAGITWATDRGAQVINLSLGGPLPPQTLSKTLQDAVDYAYSRSVTLVAAAGNAGSNHVYYPAAYPHVIAVAATDSDNQRASLSNYGPEISVAAPGVSIYSSFLGGGYGYKTGTSMASPHVSGVAAILAGLEGSGSPDLIRSRIEAAALDLGTPGKDDYYGFGLIQLDAALRLALATPTPAQTTTPTWTTSPSSTSTATEVPFQVPPAASDTPTPLPPTSTETPLPSPAIYLFSAATATPPPTAQPTPVLEPSPTPSPPPSPAPSSTSTPRHIVFEVIRVPTATPPPQTRPYLPPAAVNLGIGLLSFGVGFLLLQAALAYKSRA